MKTHYLSRSSFLTGKALYQVIQQREKEWLEQVTPCSLRWRRVDDLEWSDGVRVNGLLISVRRGTAMKIADKVGARLPTKEEADLMVHRAYHAEPQVVRPVEGMSSNEAIRLHSDAVAVATPDDVLYDNFGKLWIQDGTNYGWWEDGAPYRSSGLSLWQPFSPYNHGPEHVDYSQTLRLVRSVAAEPEPSPESQEPARVVRMGWKRTPSSLAAFVQSRSFTKGRDARARIRGVVIHSAEIVESNTAAERLQAWTASGTAGVSWHYAVDNDSITQSVLECDTAWAAGPGNDEWIHIELAGYHHQTPQQWRDAFSSDVLANAAELVADILSYYDIPPVWLTAEEVAAGQCGITGHAEITEVSQSGLDEWPWVRNGVRRRTTHVDPGPHFPREDFAHAVDDRMP